MGLSTISIKIQKKNTCLQSIKSSTKLYYSLSDEYRAEKHDLDSKKQKTCIMKYTSNT